MAEDDETLEAHGSELCLACGMCCTGHLFIWVKLKPSELDPAERLGMQVYRADPTQRGFSQPCPLWKGRCTVYASPHYPRACRAYKCRQLKHVLAGSASLPQALAVIRQAKQLIAELEAMLLPSESANFRERLVALIEHPGAAADAPGYMAFRVKAEVLLRLYADQFGVDDLLE